MGHRVVSAIRAARPSVSFEFFPPKDAEGEARLIAHIEALGEVNPDFVSVTYGAGGSAGERAGLSLRMLRLIVGVGGPAAMAHLTVVGHTREELAGIVGEMGRVGADAVLALRGDPPGGPLAPWVARPGGFTHAVDLVRIVSDAGHDVGVAAFPWGHPGSADLDQDTAVLGMKEQAGAAFAITQMVFDAEGYRELAARTARAGIGLPIVPGIMPVSAASQVGRLEAYSGRPLPGELLRRLGQAGGEVAAQAEVGIAWAAQEVRELFEAGAPGVHFYTLNRSGSSLEVCRRVGLGAR
jgi:methylenetetrahydrofolate reductase (NADPH)